MKAADAPKRVPRKSHKYDSMAPPLSRKEVRAAAGVELEQSFWGFVDLPLVITVQMPKRIEAPQGHSKLESLSEGSANPGEALAGLDRQIIEVPPEVEFSRLIAKVQRMYTQWTQANTYVTNGSTTGGPGEGHPPIGLFVIEQTHELHPMPVMGIGQVIHGDLGMGKQATIDVIETYFKRPWTALQVWFSGAMDSSRGVQDLVSSLAIGADGEMEVMMELSSPALVPFFRVAHIQPVLDKDLLHADTVGIRNKELRNGTEKPSA